MRKTIEVKQILDYVNSQLQRTDEFADDKFKAGMCTVIEQILYDSGRYSGYRPLNDADVDEPGYFNRTYHYRSYHMKI